MLPKKEFIMEKINKENLSSYFVNNIPKKIEQLYGEKYIQYRKKFSAPDYQGLPLHLDLDLRDACNLNCIMCHQSYRKRTNDKMTKELLEKAISDFAENGLCAVNIGASCEPLLEKDLFFYALKLCEKYNIMDIFVHTNGLLLTTDVSEKILETKIKHLCISLDAASPEVYHKVRGVDKYNELSKNILQFVQMRNNLNKDFPEVRISFCINNYNINEQELFLKNWQSKVDLMEFQSITVLKDNLISKDKFIHKDIKNCKEGVKRVMLWPNGDISPCCFAQNEIVFGNIKYNTVKEIFTSERYKEVLDSLKQQETMTEICKKCVNNNFECKEVIGK